MKRADIFKRLKRLENVGFCVLCRGDVRMRLGQRWTVTMKPSILLPLTV